jgi:hypothetical protein
MPYMMNSASSRVIALSWFLIAHLLLGLAQDVRPKVHSEQLHDPLRSHPREVAGRKLRET